MARPGYHGTVGAWGMRGESGVERFTRSCLTARVGAAACAHPPASPIHVLSFQLQHSFPAGPCSRLRAVVPPVDPRGAAPAPLHRRLRRVVGACVLAALGWAAVDAAVVLEPGVVAPTDLISPVDVHITAAVGEDRVANAEGQLLPAVARWDAGAADAAERTLTDAFVRARRDFRRSLEAAFGATSISEEKIGSLRFQSFRSEWVAGHPEFPVGYVLAASWARGDDGEVIRARMAGAVGQIMRRQLIGRMPEAGTVFVLALPRGLLMRSWSEASPAVVRAVDRRDVLPLAAARAELWRSLGVGERFAGGFLETLIHENVSYDARLTALFLHERLGSKLQGRFFGRGDVLVRAGATVDRPAADALHQLEALGLAPLVPAASAPVAAADPAVAATAASEVAAPAVPAMVPDFVAVAAEQSEPSSALALPVRWMLAIAAGGLLSFALGGWVYLRLWRLRRASLTIGGATAEPGMREVLAPHLAREMTRQGMDVLFDQRQELLQASDVAAKRVTEAELRVAKVQPAIQERMQNYERRIKALERELQER